MNGDPIPGPIAAALRVACDEQAVCRMIAAADGADASEVQLAFVGGLLAGLTASSQYLAQLVDDLQQHGFRGSDD